MMRRIDRARATRSLGALRAVFAAPALRPLHVAWAASYAGEAIATVAFGVLAYRAGGAEAVALLVAAQMLPALVLAPVLSALGEHRRRERLLLAVDSARAALAVGATALVWLGAPRGIMFALAGALTVAGAVSNPPRRGLL